MKRHHSSMACATGIAAALAAALAWTPAPALAQIKSGDVTGVDYWYSTSLETEDTSDTTAAYSEAGAVDILTVTGSEDDILYVNVYRDGKPIASHLAFDLSENAQADGDSYVGVMSLSIKGFDPNNHSYTLRAYNDREEGDGSLVYEGGLSQVFARFGADGPIEAVALRTLSADESRPLSMPQALSHDGVYYSLASETPDAEGAYLYEAKDPAASVQVKVAYYDIDNPSGDPLKTDTHTLALGKSATYPVDVLVGTSDGSFYRSLQVTNQVTAGYGTTPGETDFAIMCRKIEGDWGSNGKPYVARIKYWDTEADSTVDTATGTELPAGLLDQLIVNKEYRYTPPTYIYMETVDESGEKVVVAYELVLADDETAESKALDLRPGDEQEEYRIGYRRLTESLGTAWAVTCINGTVAENASNRVLSTTLYSGVTEDEPVTHKIEQSISATDADGKAVTLVPVMVTDSTGKMYDVADSYELTFDAGNYVKQLTVYYADQNVTDYPDYNVTVRYVNIADNTVLETQSVPVSGSIIEQRAYVDIAVPASLSAGGNSYVRLNGQSDNINHSYFSPHTYTVYYRDVNDDLHEKTVITKIRTVYDGTSFTDYGTTDNGTSTVAGTGAGADNGASNASLNSDNGGVTAVSDGNGNTTLVRDDGSSVTGERIDDESNPLAAPDATGEGAQAPATAQAHALPTAAIATVIAALAGILLLLLLKRNKDAEDAEDEE